MSGFGNLLDARYSNAGDKLPVPEGLINSTVSTILQHKSVRRFLPEKLPEGTLEILVTAAQSAASSSNLQAWSVVAIEDPERKDQAATLSGDQDFIRKAPLFLVFCADLSRLTHVSQQLELPGAALDYIESFILSVIDTSLAGQNTVIAAESLGLATCYVGGARNNPRELAELLHLPPRVVALFGLAVGRPDLETPISVKPRLSQSEVLHRETWDEAGQEENIAAYDKVIANFNTKEGREATTWTNRAAKRVATKESLHGRHIWNEVLHERNFNNV